MEPLPGKQAAARVKGILNAKYQVHGYAIDLTVRSISAVEPVGQVDFGGSEYKPAGKVAISTYRRQREDKYQWWDLGRSCYFVEFNETLELWENEIALLQPDERLLRAGASHVSVFLRGRVAPIQVLLHVDTNRIQIKQNARISRLRLFRFSPSRLRIEPILARARTKARKTLKRKASRRSN